VILGEKSFFGAAFLTFLLPFFKNLLGSKIAMIKNTGTSHKGGLLFARIKKCRLKERNIYVGSCCN